MKVILSNPTSNTFCKSVAIGLAKANLLAEYHTSVAVFPNSILDRLGEINSLAEIRRRSYDPILKPYMKTFPFSELGRHFSNKVGLTNLTNKEGKIFNINSINTGLDKRVAKRLINAKKNGVEAVFSYEDIAAHSFRKANTIGLKCLYELPIGYWRSAYRLLREEQEIWPEWANTITGFEDSDEKLERKEDEIRLADKIFVASSFTAKTLEEYPGKLPPIEMIPYAFPKVISDNSQYSSLKNNRKNKLKLLFVGGLSQRKGIANLFEAVKGLQKYVDLTVVGKKLNDNCPALDLALSKHTWIPTLPNDQVLSLMRENDVLMFPSLFEGFGLVITEAMSQGTPVITTDRTAGKEFINNGRNGWLVEAGSTEDLKIKIESLINNREKLEEVSREALITAKNRTWETYSNEIANAVKRSL